jgi:hypothetical protein
MRKVGLSKVGEVAVRILRLKNAATLNRELRLYEQSYSVFAEENIRSDCGHEADHTKGNSQRSHCWLLTERLCELGPSESSCY